MAYSSPLTGEYLRAFERHATKSDPERGATVPCWEIVAYAADILDIAARELGDSLDMCRLARSLGIGGVVLNKYVDMLKPSEKGIILIGVNDGEAIVVLRETLCREEKRFTLAHELAHHIIHKRIVSGTGVAAALYNHDANEDATEWQANYLAKAILMPNGQVKRCFYALRPVCRSKSEFVCKMAEIFEVSKQAMEIRLKEFALI